MVGWGDYPYGETEGTLRLHEVRTDAQGAYRFPALPPGPLRVTVMAVGSAPDTSTIELGPKATKLDFQLKRGKLLRFRFVNSQGKPIGGVYVSIRGWRGVQSLYNTKHPKVLDTTIPKQADKNGIFEWTWAPDDEVLYSWYKIYYSGAGSGAFKADGTDYTIVFSIGDPQ